MSSARLSRESVKVGVYLRGLGLGLSARALALALALARASSSSTCSDTVRGGGDPNREESNGLYKYGLVERGRGGGVYDLLEVKAATSESSSSEKYLVVYTGKAPPASRITRSMKESLESYPLKALEGREEDLFFFFFSFWPLGAGAPGVRPIRLVSRWRTTKGLFPVSSDKLSSS